MMASFTWVLATLLLLLFDVGYFVRTICHAIIAKVLVAIKIGKRQPMAEGEVWGLCFTTDMDFMWHMNNARYLRECDFGRVDLWIRNGIYDTVAKLGGGITLSASTIRYRKSLQLFDTYVIKSKIVCWDEKSFYVEQQIVRNRDKFVCAIIIARQSLMFLSPAQVLLELTGEQLESPEYPEEVKVWQEYNRLSSEKLKKAA